ncbi:uncharacterized protein LOC123501815 isoform X3 [Portunus trituberculatus]|uniref:uncharacterized protein LOC123501815 isoform X3 n=1 Tax=Portunus trituberculatus TaxID=210409 RepID=UPI001E1D1B9B|nr:uncharacterized protein LOC123501815 isoform X3 [Portunus trituberculatus]
MEDSRATLPEVLKVATPPRLPPAHAAAATERRASPARLAAEHAAAAAAAAAEQQRRIPPSGGLQGAWPEPAALGVESARGEEKGAGGEVECPRGSLPPPVDRGRGFLPGGRGEAARCCPEKPHTPPGDRKDLSGPPDAAAEAWRVPPRPREHKSLAPRRVESPLSQLSNPRHDAHLAHAIRELHEEEFGLDAVLLAEGGHVGAHCAVLAAASPFLKSLLLHATDHPAIISVTDTSLEALQALVTCLYTGTVPHGVSLHHLAELARLLRMDDLSAVLQKAFLAQGGPLLELSRPQGPPPRPPHASHLGHPDYRRERSSKKVRSSRLDEILYRKLNVDHLAPSDAPDPCPGPPAAAECPRVPGLDPPRGAAPDLRGGILGELLTKADPLRSMFAAGSYAAFPDLDLDASLKPLNLSKAGKAHAASTAADLSPSQGCHTSTASCSLNSSLASQTDLSLGGLSSLAPSLPAAMTGLLAPLTPSNMISPTALATLTSSSMLASLGAQQALAKASTTTTTTTSSSTSSSSSKNRNGSKGIIISGSNSSGSSALSSSPSSQHALPLLYTLKSGLLSPEAAKEVYEQLKLHPHLASLSGLDTLHGLSSLGASAGLHTLAGLHSLSSPHSFPALFPFLAHEGGVSTLGAKDSHEARGGHSPREGSPEDQGALNLSSTANSSGDSPRPAGGEERTTPDSSTPAGYNPHGDEREGGEEAKRRSPSPEGARYTTCHTPHTPHHLANSLMDSGQGECPGGGGPLPPDGLHPGLTHPGASLPLLLMSSGAGLAGLSQAHPDLPKTVDVSVETTPITKQEPPLVSLDDNDGDDNGIEVIEEIPCNRNTLIHVRKPFYHTGITTMGRKRKGCGECEGCQVVEDCGQCRFCRDKAKFGGPNRLKQVCVYKRCVLAEMEPEDAKKRRKTAGKKGRGKCGGCDGCQRTLDCNECYACLHNAAAQPPARRKVCEMRVCEQQQMEEVRAALSVAGEPSPYSTDSLMAETFGISTSGASSPTPDGQASTHNDKMKLMRKMLKKKFAQPYSRVSPPKVRTKYYCGECPGCQTTVPCGNCLYCEDMPKFGGPGRYRQKCVKQLCVYHPRLQALKLSNRTRLTYDEQHISQETLSQLGTVIPAPSDEAIDLGCGDSREHQEEVESLEGTDQADEVDDVTEGEDSNATIHVLDEGESKETKEEPHFGPDRCSPLSHSRPHLPVSSSSQLIHHSLAGLPHSSVLPASSVLTPAAAVLSSAAAAVLSSAAAAAAAVMPPSAFSSAAAAAVISSAAAAKSTSSILSSVVDISAVAARSRLPGLPHPSILPHGAVLPPVLPPATLPPTTLPHVTLPHSAAALLHTAPLSHTGVLPPSTPLPHTHVLPSTPTLPLPAAMISTPSLTSTATLPSTPILSSTARLSTPTITSTALPATPTLPLTAALLATPTLPLTATLPAATTTTLPSSTPPVPVISTPSSSVARPSTPTLPSTTALPATPALPPTAALPSTPILPLTPLMYPSIKPPTTSLPPTVPLPSLLPPTPPISLITPPAGMPPTFPTLIRRSTPTPPPMSPTNHPDSSTSPAPSSSSTTTTTTVTTASTFPVFNTIGTNTTPATSVVLPATVPIAVTTTTTTSVCSPVSPLATTTTTVITNPVSPITKAATPPLNVTTATTTTTTSPPPPPPPPLTENQNDSPASPTTTAAATTTTTASSPSPPPTTTATTTTTVLPSTTVSESTSRATPPPSPPPTVPTTPPSTPPSTSTPANPPSPTLMPAPKEVETAAVNETEGNEERNDEEYEGETIDLTEGSDIPSPPSTPSPQPKSRGRMQFRGHGRGQVKNNKTNTTIETRQQTAVRRGSRRRTTRFKLDPDDNSDFEEMLEELEAGGRKDTSSGGAAAPVGAAPPAVAAAGTTHKDCREKKAPQDTPKDPQVNRVDTSSPLVTMMGARAHLGQRAKLAYPGVGCRPGKMVSRAQNTEPDIFEFQEGRECVVEGKVEAGEAVALKRAGPCAFPEEELSQGGRDVNENVGAMSEAASA